MVKKLEVGKSYRVKDRAWYNAHKDKDGWIDNGDSAAFSADMAKYLGQVVKIIELDDDWAEKVDIGGNEEVSEEFFWLPWFFECEVIEVPEENVLVSSPPLESNHITFFGSESTELLKLCGNGDILVKGKLIENDKEVVGALKEFINHQQKRIKND